MQYWEEIIHTAMLGTGKKTPDRATFPVAMQEVLQKVQQSAADTEEGFLQWATLAYNFRQCSVTGMAGSEEMISRAPEETLPYCSADSLQVLSQILDTGSVSLLQLWLHACTNQQQVVLPEMLPRLLDTAVKHKDLRTAVAICCGNRGQWLGTFNPEWDFGTTATPEKIWQTGTLQQRVQVLAHLRANEPAKALAWLQQTWPQEDAATKAELMAVLQHHISAADLSFLEGLLTEKSKKVKEAATLLLKFIPESAMVQLYWKVLKEAVSLTKEKALLGLTTKTKLVVQLPETIDEAVYTSGIEKLSSNATQISDEKYVLQQLASQVPPDWWEVHLGETRENIMSFLRKNEEGKWLIPAICKAAIRFKAIGWLQAIVAADTRQLYPEALPLLPDNDREQYALQIMNKADNQTESVLQNSLDLPAGAEWSIPLTQQLFTYISVNPWRYNREFFNLYIHLLPHAFTDQLDAYAPANEYQQNSWNQVKQHIKTLLQLKAHIQLSFNQ